MFLRVRGRMLWLGMIMKIVFNQEERDYIVNNKSSDLVLTGVGMELVERTRPIAGEYIVEADDEDYNSFLDILRDEFIWKTNRISDPAPLIGLAKRFLDDYDLLRLKKF